MVKKISLYPNLESRWQKEDFKTRVPYTIEHENIPKDAHAFYKSFSLLLHPRTGKEVQRLTGYQYKIWNCRAKSILVCKSQKSGLSTSELIHDFQEVLLNPGHDLLVVGQSERQAIEHIYTLKRLITDSDRYRKYLITDSSELHFREEKTKAHVLYIKNPLNPFRPSRIIGLGFSVSALWSWKNIIKIHLSDPAAAQVTDDSQIYAALMSRLTNTDGRLLIEGPPRGPNGKFYDLYEQFKDNKDKNWHVFVVTIYDALREGLVTQQFIDKARLELGHLFPQTYEASFTIGAGDIFEPGIIERAVELGNQLKDIPISPYTLKVLAVDPAYGGSSKTALLLAEHLQQGKVIVRYTEQFARPDPRDIANRIFEIHRQQLMNTWILVDSSEPGLIKELRVSFNEDTDPESNEPSMHKVIAVNFREGKEMLSNLRMLMYKELIAIPSEHQDLIKGLLTAKVDSNFNLSKQETQNDDLVDCLRMLTKAYFIH
jgi:hypothetical protein